MPIKGDNIFEEIKQIQKAVKELPLQIGNKAEIFFKKNFDLEGFQGNSGLEQWAQRSPMAARNNGRKLLRDSGDLYNDIEKRVIGNSIKVLVAGNSARYADAHNFGETIKIRVTPKMKAWAFAMFKKTNTPFYFNLSITTKKVIEIKMPKRQFIGNSTQLDRIIKELIEKKLLEATK